MKLSLNLMPVIMCPFQGNASIFLFDWNINKNSHNLKTQCYTKNLSLWLRCSTIRSQWQCIAIPKKKSLIVLHASGIVKSLAEKGHLTSTMSGNILILGCWTYTFRLSLKIPCTKPSGEAPKTPVSWSHIPTNNIFF